MGETACPNLSFYIGCRYSVILKTDARNRDEIEN